ncbi:ribbon-helix-helix domain-containing protein [Mesorhizobium sp. CAU 1741]|uniref:ribbon-helix-helix domain-containing protein n=1 Tax=Mesorhizobium sp. CAU 1741 TaxID=3140366 RepID=UPI00325A53C9
MSAIFKRSVSIRGHRTSFSLEQPFHEELLRIAGIRKMPLAQLVGEIDETRDRQTNLSSALRLHVLDWYRAQHRSSS